MYKLIIIFKLQYIANRILGESISLLLILKWNIITYQRTI